MSNEVALGLEYQRFEDIHFDLITQCNILKEKREKIDSLCHGEELTTVWMMDSWSAADSLKRREDEVLSDRKTRYNIDTSIVALYMKVLSIQSSRVQHVMKKLEQLLKKNDADVCPPDYTVLSYQEWSRTYPKIHALQSEILDLLAQKIKSLNIASEEEKHRRSSTLHNEVDIEKLRSQTYFFVERDPVVDTDFTLHVSSVVNVNTNTFEAKKMREFIHQCWDSYEAGDKDMHYSEFYQEFVCALTEHILTKFGHMRRSGNSKVDITRDQIFAIIEGHLIPQISDCIFEKDPSDLIISEQYKTFSNLTQMDIGIKPEYMDSSCSPYHDAIFQLKCLSLVKQPTQKLRAVIMAAHATINRMVEICSNADVVAGADEFIDVWVYVVLQAGVTDLCSNIIFLRNYCNPSYMLSETGYYLSSLELASEFIKKLGSETLGGGIDRGKRLIFLSGSSSKMKKFCQNDDCPFVLIDESFLIQGYELLVVFDWFNNPCRLLHSAFREIADSPPIHASLYQFKRATTIEKFKKLLYQNSPDIELKYSRIDNVNIVIPILNVSESRTQKSISTPQYVRLHKETDETVSILSSYYNLSALGIESSRQKNVIEALEHLLEDLKTMELLFSAEYLSCFLNGNKQDVNGIIRTIQDALKCLDYYSKLLPSDGRYSTILQKAVARFQRGCNSNMNKVDNDDHVMHSTCVSEMRDDGRADVRTLQVIYKQLENGKKDQRAF